MKLFKDIDTTHLYDGIDIDQATIQQISDWYFNREVCDDDNFEAYFRRKLNIDIRQYNELIRLEFTEFDPLVSSYHESLTRTEGSHTGSVGEEGTHSNTVSGQDSHTTTFNDSTAHTGTVRNNGTTSGTSSNSDNSDVGNLQRGFPVNVGGYGNTGYPSSLSWDAVSGQEETKSQGSSSGTTSGSSDNTTTNNLTDTKTGTDTVAGSNSQTDAGTDSRTQTTAGTDENETQYISTGRDGLTPQEALQKAMDYVKISCAFTWLKDELDECFISVYDI